MKIEYDKNFSNGKTAFENMAELQNMICSIEDNSIDVNLTKSVRYGKTFIFLLGCLIVLGMQNNKKIRLNLSDNRAMEHFRQMGILDFYRERRHDCQTFFRLEKLSDVIRLVEKNMQDAPIIMTEKMSEILVSLIGEVYNNAVEHSCAKYVMGGSYKKNRKLYFSCYDTGIGIIESVKNFLLIDRRSLDETFEFNQKVLKWALGKGNSTKPPPRGVGLDWLLNFARLNEGRITICSANILFTQNSSGKHIFSELSNSFQGTFFEMEIVEDLNVIYKLKGER